MSDLLDEIKNKVEKIALDVVTLEENDIPSMGNILNCLCDLEESSQEIRYPSLMDLITSLKGYLEKVILREADDLKPIEDGINCLQSVFRCMDNKKEFKEDISDVLNKLGFQGVLPRVSDQEKSELVNTKGERDAASEPPMPLEGKGEEDVRAEMSDKNLSDDDREIIGDFVIESLEGLGTIEVNLMNLEQDPNNLDCINAIFRPFHTIKGVSGFVNLTKINKLAHSAENLLDKARNGEMVIEGPIIDIILESVDMLKKMVEDVQEGLDNGTVLDKGMDTSPLINRIDSILSQADQIGDKPLGQILVQKGVIESDDLEKGLNQQKKEPEKKIGEILVKDRKVDPKEVIAGLREQKTFSPRHVDLQVKVDTKKLDNLVDLTGELVIAQSMLRQNHYIASSSDQGLYRNLSQLTQITSGLQSTAMSMRMVPVKHTFQKMVRLVRDLAKNSGKEVKLEMTGEDTEIDRNVVEELYDPMVHMIRNAVDHGIEFPHEREEKGKDRKGTIYLRAYQRGGNIIVEIEDDGKGLNKYRIMEKARAKNLITDEAKLSETEIFNMIFEAGFSTAEKITDISGRGVGMDVVRKGIEKLRGRVEIFSRPDKGSTFVISLPLTLAIIEGMLVRVGTERYIIPALTILESFQPEESQYFTVEKKGEMIKSREKVIPLIRLDRLFGVEGDSVQPWDGLGVSVEHEGKRICLLLDELLGKEEVVIKNLGESLKNVKGIAGGAIMGDGRVGLILDMAGIFELAGNN